MPADALIKSSLNKTSRNISMVERRFIHFICKICFYTNPPLTLIFSEIPSIDIEKRLTLRSRQHVGTSDRRGKGQLYERNCVRRLLQTRAGISIQSSGVSPGVSGVSQEASRGEPKGTLESEVMAQRPLRRLTARGS